ncbi:hypothetical protein B0H16DRAFT_1726688 [Mycena metata]|uniref:Uncharacterized protein n=1 Tax=Mycena metata TaxID=1033252 RepID=A0AAD7N4M0_9AGAR|nr:hypothetical protein B0H16DRAFT_1726688 [Mycena metata]
MRRGKADDFRGYLFILALHLILLGGNTGDGCRLGPLGGSVLLERQRRAVGLFRADFGGGTPRVWFIDEAGTPFAQDDSLSFPPRRRGLELMGWSINKRVRVKLIISNSGAQRRTFAPDFS